jgi:hypothetical protein
MRFDTPVYFQEIVKGAYNANTGDYSDDIVAEVKRYASVTNTGTDALQLLYGTIKQNSLTVRLQNSYSAPFDRIRIGKKVYSVDKSRQLRNKQTFIVSEVQ